MPAASLIVTIDTEEEGLWSGTYRRTGNTVANAKGLRRFQALCDAYGVRPTYLVDAPVIEDRRASEILRSIHDEGRAEIGAHVHPWCNPPLDEKVSPISQERASFLCNLPASLQREKILWLTEAIEERFGRRPTSFRAGRYGLDIVGARILSNLGYVVDSSVIPFSDFSVEGGPDFRHAPYDPYFVQGNDLCQAHSSGFLVEVPVTVGYNRRKFHRADAARNFAARTPLRQLRCVGILDRLGIVQRIKFSPEQADDAQMKRLVDVRMRQAAPSLVLMFHSSSLAPGYSPYVPDDRALERFYERLDRVFEYCVCDLKCASFTLSDFARKFMSRQATVL